MIFLRRVKVQLLCSRPSHSDRAAVDASRMKELEGILAEARDLESYLKEKKQHLRQMLAVISDKLQG